MKSWLGHLIILPKLLGYLIRQPQRKIAEGLLRLHYLVSIATVNVGLLLMLALPFSDSIKTMWLPLTALPYYLLYGRDLILCGYRASDLLRVYALNLLLIPVNLGGVLKSLQQAITHQKIAFCRTPKITVRTTTAPLYIIAIYALFGQWLISAQGDFVDGHLSQGIFALLNAAILFYAIAVFIGFRASWDDIRTLLQKSGSDPMPASSPEDMLAVADNVAIFQQKFPQFVQHETGMKIQNHRQSGG